VDDGALGCRQTRRANALGGAWRRPDSGDTPFPLHGNNGMGTCDVFAAFTMAQSAANRPAEPTPLVVRGT